MGKIDIFVYQVYRWYKNDKVNTLYNNHNFKARKMGQHQQFET